MGEIKGLAICIFRFFVFFSPLLLRPNSLRPVVKTRDYDETDMFYTQHL